MRSLLTTRRILVALACCSPLAPRPLQAQTRCEAPWTLRETLRIGSIDGPDALAGVLDVELGPDGRIYVTQPFIAAVTVFTSDGRLNRTIGRAGDGPGEFVLAPSKLGWIRDTLWVTDFGHMHFFKPDGTESRQVRFLTASEASRFAPGMPLADGSFFGSRRILPQFFRADRFSLPRFSPAGEILDTIAWIEQPPVVKVGGYAYHPLSDLDAFSHSFTPTPEGSAIVLVGETRNEVSRSRLFNRFLRPRGTFDLLKLSITGDTLVKRTIPYETKPVTAAERTWLTDAFAHRMAGDYSSGPNTLQKSEPEKERARREAREAITLPEHHPPVRRIVAGHDGSIWLLRELTFPDLVDRWEVYSSSGQLEGTVVIREGKSSQTPWHPRLKLFRATREEVWGTTVDELRTSTATGWRRAVGKRRAFNLIPTPLLL